MRGVRGESGEIRQPGSRMFPVNGKCTSSRDTVIIRAFHYE